MENVHDRANGNGVVENGHCTATRHYDYQSSSCTIKSSLSWLDLRVFYVRLCKCEIDESSTPEFLTFNHVPLNRDTLLEVNGVRTSLYSDGVSTVLRRDRVDKKSEEVTFVSTDSIRMTGSVKFEVFDKDVLVLSGSLEACDSNGYNGGESRHYEHHWSMNCGSGILHETGLNQYANSEQGSPAIEVYVAGSFLGSPIILTKTLHFSLRRKQMRKTMLDSIPEYEASEYQKDSPSSTLQMQMKWKCS
ncbi:OLC1v1003198C2 [Oldenlandia corymbosa var. corymbosa]|uniref:OLC1v1003198C2 n=1 Tax=Oldenlandia corymbosa var. corymbosa TaxID=529605 RepID=A0AAV1D9H5_OLDCO|nr:OLC1v1003198C2 [Oldenlandia corymbosa var. corymbosa]